MDTYRTFDTTVTYISLLEIQLTKSLNCNVIVGVQVQKRFSDVADMHERWLLPVSGLARPLGQYTQHISVAPSMPPLSMTTNYDYDYTRLSIPAYMVVTQSVTWSYWYARPLAAAGVALPGAHRRATTPQTRCCRRHVSQSGSFGVVVGSSSVDIRLSGSLTRTE